MLTRDLLFLTAWATLIFVVSSIPRLESGLEHDYVLRKIAHVAEFAMLTMLTIRVLRHVSARRLDTCMGSGLLACTYAFSDEVHQLMVPGRSGTLYDVGIDSIGIMLVMSWILVRGIRRNPLKDVVRREPPLRRGPARWRW